MPNLKRFELKVLSKKINNDFNTKFIKRLLELNFNYIYFSIRATFSFDNNSYSNDELKQIYQDKL